MPLATTPINRRTMLAQSGLAVAALAATAQVRADRPAQTRSKAASVSSERTASLKYSLNTATLRGQKLSLPEEIEIAAKAGYHAVEPWLEEIHRYIGGGGKAADLKKQIADLGLVVPSSIGFADWVNEDESRRTAGLEQWKREADLVASIGGVRMAAPPTSGAGATIELQRVAERYRKLLDVSCPMGIVPELEMWGNSKSLSRMSQVAYVLVETGHPDACGLLDIYHIFKGGSDFAGVQVFNGNALHVTHVNDYPPTLTRAKATDAYRVYPGDGGGAPIVTFFRDLLWIGYNGYLSLELFNADYWKQDALTVARTGREKIQALAEKAAESLKS